jgi:hypothetical protein
VTTYETKDSGTHLEYHSGMRRDSQDGKPRFDLIRTKRQPYEEQMIYRYAMLLARGAEKYSARNWEEGNSEEELERAKASLLRHTEQLVAGETDEDHAAAVWFNSQAIEYFRWRLNSHQPQTDEEAVAAERAKRASEIRREAMQMAQAMRRRERLRVAAKDFDAELTKDAQALAAQSLPGPSGFAEIPVTPEEDEAWKERKPIDVNDDGTPFYGYDRSKSGAYGLYQFIPGDWSAYQEKLGHQIAANLRRHAFPYRFVAGMAKPDPDPADFPDSYPDAN